MAGKEGKGGHREERQSVSLLQSASVVLQVKERDIRESSQPNPTTRMELEANDRCRIRKPQ